MSHHTTCPMCGDPSHQLDTTTSPPTLQPGDLYRIGRAMGIPQDALSTLTVDGLEARGHDLVNAIIDERKRRMLAEVESQEDQARLDASIRMTSSLASNLAGITAGVRELLEAWDSDGGPLRILEPIARLRIMLGHRSSEVPRG